MLGIQLVIVICATIIFGSDSFKSIGKIASRNKFTKIDQKLDTWNRLGYPPGGQWSRLSKALSVVISSPGDSSTSVSPLAGASSANVISHQSVWDLYGRVPHDDWLFHTSNLIGKNILKKSFVEAVEHELPKALSSFSRDKAIYTVLMVTKGVAYIMGGLALLSYLMMLTRQSIRKDKELEIELRGFSTPVSAVYKGANNVGRAVEGNPDWIDMSRRNKNRAEDAAEQEDKDEQDSGASNDSEKRKKNGDEGDNNAGQWKGAPKSKPSGPAPTGAGGTPRSMPTRKPRNMKKESKGTDSSGLYDDELDFSDIND